MIIANPILKLQEIEIMVIVRQPLIFKTKAPFQTDLTIQARKIFHIPPPLSLLCSKNKMEIIKNQISQVLHLLELIIWCHNRILTYTHSKLNKIYKKQHKILIFNIKNKNP